MRLPMTVLALAALLVAGAAAERDLKSLYMVTVSSGGDARVVELSDDRGSNAIEWKPLNAGAARSAAGAGAGTLAAALLEAARGAAAEVAAGLLAHTTSDEEPLVDVGAGPALREMDAALPEEPEGAGGPQGGEQPEQPQQDDEQPEQPEQGDEEGGEQPEQPEQGDEEGGEQPEQPEQGDEEGGEQPEQPEQSEQPQQEGDDGDAYSEGAYAEDEYDQVGEVEVNGGADAGADAEETPEQGLPRGVLVLGGGGAGGLGLASLGGWAAAAASGLVRDAVAALEAVEARQAEVVGALLKQEFAAEAKAAAAGPEGAPAPRRPCPRHIAMMLAAHAAAARQRQADEATAARGGSATPPPPFMMLGGMPFSLPFLGPRPGQAPPPPGALRWDFQVELLPAGVPPPPPRPPREQQAAAFALTAACAAVAAAVVYTLLQLRAAAAASDATVAAPAAHYAPLASDDDDGEEDGKAGKLKAYRPPPPAARAGSLTDPLLSAKVAVADEDGPRVLVVLPSRDAEGEGFTANELFRALPAEAGRR